MQISHLPSSIDLRVLFILFNVLYRQIGSLTWVVEVDLPIKISLDCSSEMQVRIDPYHSSFTSVWVGPENNQHSESEL